MRIGLFIPCYIDQFYPRVGIATLELLEKLNLKVEYPLSQTCCGQPLCNAGFAEDAVGTREHFFRNFSKFDFVVSPSGSCVFHLKEQFKSPNSSEKFARLNQATFELCAFLIRVLKVKELRGSFPHKVAVHEGCHNLRGLSSRSYEKQLLNKLEEIKIQDFDRQEECCGFGGTFSVKEEAVSVKMGKDKIRRIENSGAEIVTSGDMSCLMHLEGLLIKNKSNLKAMHISEILNQAM